MLRKATALSVALTAACLTAIGATLTACSDGGVQPVSDSSTPFSCPPGTSQTGPANCSANSLYNGGAASSTAPSDQSVPNIVGATVADATAALTNAGIEETTFTFVPSGVMSNSDPTSDPTNWIVVDPYTPHGSVNGADYDGYTVRIHARPVHGCSNDPDLSADDIMCKDNQTGHVVYTVTGSARGDITYSPDGTSNSEQASSVHLPWTKKFDVETFSDDTFLYVSAQNTGSGKITCKITLDGHVVSTHTSTGAYSIVTCDNS